MLPTSHISAGVAVLAPEGRFDARTAPAISEWLEHATRSGTTRIVVNMSSVNFMDSTGLAALVRFMKECRKAGGDLCLANLQQPVRIIFELTRLDSAFGIYSSVEAATESLAENPST